MTEAEIQTAVIAHLQVRSVNGAFWFHVPNGGARRPIEAAILKGQGVIAGVPDLIVVHQGWTHALELKAPGGRVSDQQRSVQNALVHAGALVENAFGLDQALSTLERWKILRHER